MKDLLTGPDLSTKPQRSQKFLAVIGVLWLVLAAAIVVSQVTRPPVIEIAWTTETELDTAGFHVYRSQDPDCAQKADCEFEQINNSIIASKGDPLTGSTYLYQDSDVDAGATYYYQLEDVEFDGDRQRHDVIAGQAPKAEWWALLLSALSVLIGLALLITGFKQEKSL